MTPRASSVAAAAPRGGGIETGAADWRSHLSASHRRRLQTWFWTIAATTFAVVVIGGITRLTQSGLSIVDWQPLIGVIPPLTETQWTEAFERYRQFPEYLHLRGTMTLGEFKVIFFWEYLHRLMARLIGLVFLVPFAVFWRAGWLPRPLLFRALALFALGATQGAVGWLMVRSGLADRPSVSHYRLGAHLVLALMILAFSIWLARDIAGPRPRRREEPGGHMLARRGLTIVGLLLAAQILWGAFVAGLKAGLIYNTFPLMAGQLVPPAGLTLEPLLLNLVQNIATVQWTHRVLGTLLLAAAAVLFLRVRRTAADATSRRLNMALGLLITFQYLVGVLTLVLRVPVILGVVHQALAAVIVALWVAWMHHARPGVPAVNR